MIKKTKIGLVIDKYDWAYDNIARQVATHLDDSFEFVIIPSKVVDNIIQIFLYLHDCDIIHFFGRSLLCQFSNATIKAYVTQLGGDYQEFYDEFVKSRVISISVYNQALLSASEIKEMSSIFQEIIDAYYVCSKKLYDIYSNISAYPQPKMILEDGVDMDLFYPINLSRFDNIQDREIVIGWAGKSDWGSEYMDDCKGYHTILKPALEQLQQEGYKIKTCFADRKDQYIPHNKMVDYYAKLDLYVCASQIEGTPNPILESMACGIPIISTDVGIVPQAFSERQTKFILKERSIGCLKEAIKTFMTNRQIFKELSTENLQSIKLWDWKIKAQGFAAYFNMLINNNKRKNL